MKNLFVLIFVFFLSVSTVLADETEKKDPEKKEPEKQEVKKEEPQESKKEERSHFYGVGGGLEVYSFGGTHFGPYASVQFGNPIWSVIDGGIHAGYGLVQKGRIHMVDAGVFGQVNAPNGGLFGRIYLDLFYATAKDPAKLTHKVENFSFAPGVGLGIILRRNSWIKVVPEFTVKKPSSSVLMSATMSFII